MDSLKKMKGTSQEMNSRGERPFRDSREISQADKSMSLALEVLATIENEL